MKRNMLTGSPFQRLHFLELLLLPGHPQYAQVTESLRLTAILKRLIVSRVYLLRNIILSILASLGLLTVLATAPAQVTNGEQNPHSAYTPSRADAASLRKKAIQAQ